MELSLDQLEFLRSPEAAELLAMNLPDDPLAAVARLRKRCDADRAGAVAELRRLRERAAERFPPELARRLLATDKLLQQASSYRLATWKAGRLSAIAAERGTGEVVDLCCGLGGDAMALANTALSVRGVDAAPEAVLCAAHNAEAAGVAARCRFELADATESALDAAAVVHVDPDRRAEGRRSVALADGSPGEGFLRRLIHRTGAGAMKLSPGLSPFDLDDLAADRLEYVSERGVCKQLIAWWGGRADGPRRVATEVFGSFEAPESVTLPAGAADYAPLGEPGEWLIEPGPAVLAAEAVDDLAAAEGLWRIEPGLPWLFGDAPTRTPLAHCFRVLADVPGREKDIARALRRLDAGAVEVKPRGLRLDTDALQRRFRGRGRRRLAVLWCRLGPRRRAFVCERSGENAEAQ